MRAALIGAGQIAKQHLAALCALPDVQVVGVCDLSPVMAESTADRFGVKRWFTDYQRMLADERPEVVHVTTPPATHFRFASDAIEAGAHVLVEKPITSGVAELADLQRAAAARGRWLLEDYNYLFNRDVQKIIAHRDSGRLGRVRHVDVQIHLDVFAPGSRFADADAPHPAMSAALGVASDFVTHLAYLALEFIGAHRRVHCFIRKDSAAAPGHVSEMQALVAAEQGTALLGFSAGSGPDAFVLRVQGSRMRAEANLFECGVVISEALGGSQPLAPIRNARRRARAERRNSWSSLSRKLSGGPGPYEGLWRLVELTYGNLQSQGEPPISPASICDVNRLVAAIASEASE